MLKNIALESYADVKLLGGGTNSTYKLSGLGLPSLVLKFGAHPEAMRVEILCQEIYKMLGGRIPDNQVFHEVPEAIAQKLGINKNRTVLVSQYIIPAKSQDQIVHEAGQHFALLALLGNIDVTKEDNFIQDKEGRVYLVDSGSNIIFRALGEKRSGVNSRVQEIDSLKNHDNNKESWFGNITSIEIESQVRSLLKNEFTIESATWELADKLMLSDDIRINFLQLLSDRFDYLAMRFCPELPRHGKIDRRADPDHTAAGVLTYTVRNNQTFVLLSQRRGSGEWNCFGGKSNDEDLYLATTASREVLEESQGGILHTQESLQSSPYSDIGSIKDNNHFNFRLYLKEHHYIDPNDIQDEEHTAHQWVSFDLFQRLLTKSHSKIKLYQPFKDILSKVTLIRNERDNRLTFAGAPGKKLLHFHSPREIKLQYTKSVYHHMKVLDEIKNRNTNDLISPNHSLTNRESQSIIHMKAVLDQSYDETNLSRNISQMTSKIVNSYEIKLQDDHIIRLNDECLKLIKNELGNKEEIFFYHACSREVAFMYDLASKLYQIMTVNRKWHAFRAWNTHFARFMNEERSSDRKQFNPQDNEIYISANLGLFGSHRSKSSCTLEYYLQNLTRKGVEFRALLKSILPIEYNEPLIEKIQKIFNECYGDQFGVLYQISVPSHEADERALICASAGYHYPYNDSTKPTEVLKSLSDDLIQGVTKARDYLIDFQARLLVAPHQSFRITKLTGENLLGSQKKKDLDDYPELVNELFQAILMKMTPSMLHESIPMRRLLAWHASLNRVPAFNDYNFVDLKSAYQNNQHDLVLSLTSQSFDFAKFVAGLCVRARDGQHLSLLLEQWPPLRTVTLPDTDEYLPSYFVKTDKDKLIYPSLADMIMKIHVNDHGEPLLLVCYGQKLAEFFPKNIDYTQLHSYYASNYLSFSLNIFPASEIESRLIDLLPINLKRSSIDHKLCSIFSKAIYYTHRSVIDHIIQNLDKSNYPFLGFLLIGQATENDELKPCYQSLLQAYAAHFRSYAFSQIEDVLGRIVFDKIPSGTFIRFFERIGPYIDNLKLSTLSAGHIKSIPGEAFAALFKLYTPESISTLINQGNDFSRLLKCIRDYDSIYEDNRFKDRQTFIQLIFDNPQYKEAIIQQLKDPEYLSSFLHDYQSRNLLYTRCPDELLMKVPLESLLQALQTKKVTHLLLDFVIPFFQQDVQYIHKINTRYYIKLLVDYQPEVQEIYLKILSELISSANIPENQNIASLLLNELKTTGKFNEDPVIERMAVSSAPLTPPLPSEMARREKVTTPGCLCLFNRRIIPAQNVSPINTRNNKKSCTVQ